MEKCTYLEKQKYSKYLVIVLPLAIYFYSISENLLQACFCITIVPKIHSSGSTFAFNPLIKEGINAIEHSNGILAHKSSANHKGYVIFDESKLTLFVTTQSTINPRKNLPYLFNSALLSNEGKITYELNRRLRCYRYTDSEKYLKKKKKFYLL